MPSFGNYRWLQNDHPGGLACSWLHSASGFSLKSTHTARSTMQPLSLPTCAGVQGCHQRLWLALQVLCHAGHGAQCPLPGHMASRAQWLYKCSNPHVHTVNPRGRSSSLCLPSFKISHWRLLHTPKGSSCPANSVLFSG